MLGIFASSNGIEAVNMMNKTHPRDHESYILGLYIVP